MDGGFFDLTLPSIEFIGITMAPFRAACGQLTRIVIGMEKESSWVLSM